MPNSFHCNGDQSGKGYSDFEYRPFTLEGNFAFASGLQEMLLQSHTGIIHLFPAVPNDWQDMRFDQLRAQGAFLISAKKVGGSVDEVLIKSTKGGVLKLKNPFASMEFNCSHSFELNTENVIVITTNPGDFVRLSVL